MLDIARLHEQSKAQARQISGLDNSVHAIRSKPQSKQPEIGQSTSRTNMFPHTTIYIDRNRLHSILNQRKRLVVRAVDTHTVFHHVRTIGISAIKWVVMVILQKSIVQVQVHIVTKYRVE